VVNAATVPPAATPQKKFTPRISLGVIGADGGDDDEEDGDDDEVS